jgi:hypothetical protein
MFAPNDADPAGATHPERHFIACATRLSLGKRLLECVVGGTGGSARPRVPELRFSVATSR